jgi:choline transport protein
MILAILNIPSTAAFGAFIALSSFGILASYLIAIGCMLHARLSREGIRYGGWRLGRWGVATNIFALAYTAYVMVFLPFPSTLPVTGTNMNYSLPIFAFAFFAALGLWVFWGKKNWKGLDAGVIALVEAESDLEMK